MAVKIRIPKPDLIKIVYVDDAIHPHRGRVLCNMFSLGIDTMHEFAKRLGVGPEWFHEPPKDAWSYYSLTYAQRAEALELGAVMTDHFKALEISMRQRGIWNDDNRAWVEQSRLRASRRAVERGDA